MENLEIIIPAHNEQENISEVIKGIRKILNGDISITVIDDASEDNTSRIAKDLGAKVIRHPYRLGNGASIKTGLRNAEKDFVLLMDGDGQHLPQDIPKLLEYIDRFDMVIGARNFREISGRNLANRFYNLFASYVTQFKIQDLTCGFRIVRRKVVLKFLYLLPNGFSYPTTLTLAFLKTGRTVGFVPISSNPRLKGKSKINLIKDGVYFLLIITRIAIFYSPLRVFIPISILFFLTGLCYYSYTFFTQHRLTNMTVILFINSMLIFLLGLISEQIAQLRLIRTEDEE